MYPSLARSQFAIPTRFTIMLVSMVCILLVMLPLATPAIQKPTFPLPDVPEFGRLPLSFVPHVHPTGSDVQFQVRGMGGSIFFAQDEILLTLPVSQDAAAHQEMSSQPVDATTLRLHFEGADPAPVISGIDQQPGVVNYFIGNDPNQWQTGIPTYAGIVYTGLYDGIDLRYDGQQGTLKGTYTVAAGADPSRIRWRYAGGQQVRIDRATGDLHITVAKGQTLVEHAPLAWQTINGQHVPVAARYTLADDGSIGFALGSYNAAHPLTIDPTLAYSTYLGGIGGEQAFGVAVDSAGNAYVTGETTSMPGASPVPPDLVSSGQDIFVTKISADGQTILYSSYFGGTNNVADIGMGIALDSANNAYVVGVTGTSDFPVVNPLQAESGGQEDVFVVKLSADGGSLLYSTYLGGSGNDSGEAIGVDSTGSAVITGYTESTDDFPTANALQTAFAGGVSDVFVARLSPDGQTLVYSTYLGGSSHDGGQSDIAVDSDGNAYIAGTTPSDDFPTTPGAFQPEQPGIRDAFVVKLSADGQTLLYSTYLGGSNVEYGRGIAVDSAGNAYVSGDTFSDDFPTVNPFQAALAPDTDFDTFVARLNPTGSALIYSTYLGGSGKDWGYAIAVDSEGHAWVAGETMSDNFPTVDPVQAERESSEIVHGDLFVTQFSPDGTSLVFSTYLGGSAGECCDFDIAVDSAGDAYVVGTTASDDFPTFQAVQPEMGSGQGGVQDAFAVKFSDNPLSPAVAPASVTIDGPAEGEPDTAYTFTATTMPTDTTTPLTYTWQATNEDEVTRTGALSDTITFTWDMTGTKTISVTASNAAGESRTTRTIDIATTPVTPTTYSISGRVIDQDNNPLADVTLSDGAGHTTTTGSDGTFMMDNLDTGSYTITPSLQGYTFEPTSMTRSVPPDATDMEFTATLESSGDDGDGNVQVIYLPFMMN